MKKLVGLLLILLAVGLVGGSLLLLSKDSSKNTTTVLPASQESILYKFEWKGETLAVVWTQEFSGDQIDLVPNFEEKTNSSEIYEINDCHTLINGGFYSQENNPIGLFITNNTTLSNWQENDLFNGVFSVNDFATPRITRNQPQDNLIHAVQTGPLLIENGRVRC